MTDKMPVVGRRYREISQESPAFEMQEISGDQFWGKYLDTGHKMGWKLCMGMEAFFEQFEELPEDNSQETEKVQIKDWHIPRIDMNNFELGIAPKAGEWVKCPHMPATPEFNKWFKEKFNCCPLTGKKLDEGNETPNPVDLQKGEVNEVEKALASLENKRHYNKGWDDGSNFAFDHIKKEVNNLTLKDNMSKPEPKIETKKERVEPVSIWKDVSELPNSYCEVLVTDNYKVGRGYYDPKKGYLTTLFESNNDNAAFYLTTGLRKYCTLADFINSFEQMQKDIEELKRNGK